MRKFLFSLFVICLALVISTPCFSSQKNTGCGLGSMAFEGKEGLVSQTFAVTTNGTFGTSTFGITSGTSNCDRPKSYTDNGTVNKFVAENMDNLASDIARGSGEHLKTLSILMEVSDAGRTQWYSMLQKNFSAIYTSPNVSHIEVIKNIEQVMTTRS